MTDAADEKESRALQVLLSESAQFEQAFRWNEEIGERRVSLVLTLMTIAAAASGVVAESVGIDARAKLRLVAVVLLALLLLGLVTLARIIRRNVATDEYRCALDTIRKRMIELVGKDLEGYWPFPRPGEGMLKRFFGLTLLMGTTNSILLTAATLLWWAPGGWLAAIVGVLVFAFSLATQTWLSRWIEGKLRMEVGLRKKR